MTAPELPTFRHHPDPLATGSVVASDARCVCCGAARGYVYSGPVYCEDDLGDQLCPWCIADGSAFARYGATFVDSEAFDADAPEAVVSVIIERTPGFNSWNSERWPSCCGEPAAFAGPIGYEQLRASWPRLEGSLMSQIVYDLGISGSGAVRLLESLRRDASPTAFAFRCLHCEATPAYIDRA